MASSSVTAPRPPTAPQMIVIFGARGDLAGRKLVPGLYKLASAGWLPAKYAVIGTGRRAPASDDEFRAEVRRRVVEFVDVVDDAVLYELLGQMSFVPSSAEGGTDLEHAVRAAEAGLERWRGVPFYLRTGKALAEGRRTVTLRYREPEDEVFAEESFPHELVLELTDDPQVVLELRGKRPGPDLAVTPVSLTVDFQNDFPQDEPLEAYERLLLDVMHGGQLLFSHAEEVDLIWQACQPLLDDPPPADLYGQGSWGPRAALSLPVGGWHLGR